MAGDGLGPIMTPAVILLTATVVAVPLFRRLGLGSVLGYFAAGLAVGPHALRIFVNPEAMLRVSELGVILFLFLIGLEMRPERLWAMRRQIVGLGATQVAVCTVLLSLAAWLAGLPPATAFIAGAGFVLSSTAVIMAVVSERGEVASVEGRRTLSILLFEDMMIVPLLAVVSLLAPVTHESAGLLRGLMLAIAAFAILLGAGRWLINPFFARLATFGTREVMSAGALLVVLGAALIMETAGLSMAMGAFMAGVLLSGSTYRHQVEADIEPFRGILMGLFFLAVGMSLDLAVVADDWRMVLMLLALFMAVKAAGVFAVARIAGATGREAIARMALFAQGGEFAFVLYGAARSGGLMDARTDAIISAVVILSMALTPVVLLAMTRLMPPVALSMEGIDTARDLKGRALVIGFGRFGQMVSQTLLAQRMPISIIDTDIEMIRAAERLGFKVYYGDGSRLDILRASGAGEVDFILVCVDKVEAADTIVALANAEFPQAKLLVRAYDRRHVISLRKAGVTFEIRETMDSALQLGRQTLIEAGLSAAEADEVVADVRRRDRARLAVQSAGQMLAGREYLHLNIADTMEE